MAEKKESAEAAVRAIRRLPGRSTRRRRRSGSCWKACGARRASPACAGGKASRPTCTTVPPTTRHLRVEQGLPRSRQAAPGGRHRAPGRQPPGDRDARGARAGAMGLRSGQASSWWPSCRSRTGCSRKACWARSRRGTSDAAVSSREAGDHPPGRALCLACGAHPERAGCAAE